LKCSETLSLPPNRRVQLTPLRGREIVRIFKPKFSWTVIAIYWAAQLTRNTLGGVQAERHHAHERS